MKTGNRQADEENLLSHRHHLVVQALWEDVEQGLPDSAELPAFLSILEVLVESISKVCRLNEHPALFLALCIGYVLIFSGVRAGSMGQSHISSIPATTMLEFGAIDRFGLAALPFEPQSPHET